MPREITATYFDGDTLNLPRGPVTEIASVKDADDTDLEYTWVTVGNRDTIELTEPAPTYPLTVVYTAGYESTHDIADIIDVIKADVGRLIRYRETHTSESINDVYKIDEFYRYRSRGIPIA